MVAIVRRAFHTRRVGHAGTLDPFATGLLLVLVGPPTRLARYLSGLPKQYQGIIRLGATTTTDDATGEVTSTSDAWTELDEVRLSDAMTALTGEREQLPPAYSAKRVGGERAHRLARRGAAVTLAPARIEIRRFVPVQRRGPDVWFQAAVGSGTYLRSLARELGLALGCGGHLLELRRTTVGPYDVEQAAKIDDVRQGRATLLPPVAALRHLASVTVDQSGRQRLLRGQPIEAALPDAAGPLAVVCDDQLVAVVQPRGGRWHPEVVLTP